MNNLHKMQPFVSIIMAEFNTNEELLIDSIKSILSQTYENFEFIIVDDCGKNDIELISKKFDDKRIKIIKNATNKGLVYSLNKALELASGKYIFRMDTDDYSYNNRLDKVVKFMIDNPKYDVVGTRCDFYDGQSIWGESIDYGDVTKEKILNGCPLIHPSVAFKKSCMNKIGGYLNYERCEDYATWIEAYTKGYKMTVLNDKLVRYHLSIDDYKKRTIKKRKGFLRLLNTQYKKLKPTKVQVIKMFIKTIIAGIVPYKIIYRFHKKKFKQK